MSKRLNVFILFVLCVVASSVTGIKGVHAVIESELRSPSPHQIFIVSVPGLSFQELAPGVLEQYPQLNELVQQGMIGALNVRTPYKGIEDSYLTMGAGAIATSKPEYSAWQHNERKQGIEAGVLYERNTGHHRGYIVVPEFYAITQLNANTTYKANLGWLGDRLERAGMTLALYGNRDRGLYDDESALGRALSTRRDAALMLMNSKGTIEHGEIGQRVISEDVTRPYSVKTNYDFIVSDIKRLPRPAVVMVELGDLDRLYAEQAVYAPERFAQLKTTILTEIDAFIEMIVAQMNKGDRLLIFSPQVHPAAERAKLLFSPVIVYEPDGAQGFVSSSTTQRDGIVAHVDIAPTILHALELEKADEMVGFPFVVTSNHERWTWLYDEVQAAANVYLMRPKLLYCYVVLLMIGLLLGLAVAIYPAPRIGRFIAVLLLATLVAPPILLYFSIVFQLERALVIVTLFIMISVICATLIYRLNVYRALTLLSLATVLLLCVDGMLGSQWMKRSVLGYDAMIGARYYGIGNEYAGVLIGAAVLLVSLFAHFLYERYPKQVMLLSCLLFVTIIIYLLMPTLGTNAGAAIAATVTFGIAGLRMFAGKLLREVHWQRLVLIVMTLGIVAFVGLWLANKGSSHSHIGRAMQLVTSGELDAIGAIISRKLSMNWHLIGVSSWSKVLVTSLIVIAAIVLRPRGVFAEWQTSLPMLMYGFSAIAIGAIVILLVNDSGIVAAATMIIYAAVPMLLIKLQDISSSHRS